MSTPAVLNLIASVIDRFGGDSYESRVDKNTWRINVGSAGGFVALFEDQDDPDSSDLLVFFPLMRVPLAKSLAFYRRLLEINDELFGKAAFAVDKENVVSLLAGRKIFDLDPDELAELMLHTSTLADYYDDVLLDEFGRENALT